MAKREISNSEDVLDSRDIITRVEELESELQGVTEDDKQEEQDAEIKAELEPMLAFLEEMKGAGGDAQWRGDWYPVTLIRDSYWKEYAQEYAEDVGAIPDNSRWPCTCIDWDQAARELRMDYTCADFDGVTYWFR